MASVFHGIWFSQSVQDAIGGRGLRLAAELTTGKALPFAFSLGNAEYILSFGANLFEGASATSLVFPAIRQWDPGGGDLGETRASRVSLLCYRFKGR